MMLNPSELSAAELQRLMAGSIAPRPIALVSTIDSNNIPNLSPFSFFNSFSINPPVLVFSPSRRVRDNTVKHTYENIQEVPEACINVVNFAIVEQVNLSSTEYARGVNEFIKSGLTPVTSQTIRPFGVMESPVRFECIVTDIIRLGKEGGAGNLVICQIKLIHINPEILNEKGIIDPNKIDLVGRLGEDYYCRASGESLFTVKKPLTTIGIGIDSLPSYIKYSNLLNGNELGQLGNIEKLPEKQEIENFKNTSEFNTLKDQTKLKTEKVYHEASEFISRGEIVKALLWLMAVYEEL